MIGVGDKVVCVSGDFDRPFGETVPTLGLVYTVRDIMIDGGKVYLRFEEIINQPQTYNDGFTECDFPIHCFRPVKKTKTDISIFQEIDREIFGRVDA
jgi:hypothetical protein